MDTTEGLQLVGILPVLADEVFAAADVRLRLHYGGRALAAGDDIGASQVRWCWRWSFNRPCALAL